MDYKETKISKFLSGKGFYLALAGCLVATGVAAWTAYAGLSNPDTAEKPDDTSSYISSAQPDADEVQNDTSDIPYSSEVTSSEPIVAENFIYPLSGNITKKFSEDEVVYSETYADYRLHTGLDIEGELGTAVNACGSGTVTDVADDPVLGRYVEVDHGKGITAKYCGLADNVSVEVGSTVSAGTKLGLLADVPSECADGAHLHLEFFKDGAPVNPISVIEE